MTWQWKHSFPSSFFVPAATEQTAATQLQRSSIVPDYAIPFEETQWGVFTSEGAFTFGHVDTLFTGVRIFAGGKLWFLARNIKGDFGDRTFFDVYDPWSAMTDRFKWECVYLDANVTLCVMFIC